MSAESGWRRITEVLDRHGVEYLIVGGVAARLHLSVDEARALPIPLDGLWLAGMDVSTWRTDAGDLDVVMRSRRATAGVRPTRSSSIEPPE